MDVIKELEIAQKNYNEKLAAFHRVALLPLTEGKEQANAVDYYGILLTSLMGFIEHMHKFYNDRPEVREHIRAALLNVTDKAEAMLDERDWSTFLDEK
jgi:hypothetical protein